MPSVLHACIHRARIVRTAPASGSSFYGRATYAEGDYGPRDSTPARDEQGERVRVDATGPWFPARLVGQRPGREGAADAAGHRRVESNRQLIFADRYSDGTPLIDPPRASDRVEVDRLIPGEATRLYEVASPTEPYDRGYGPFGGQVDLVEAVLSV